MSNNGYKISTIDNVKYTVDSRQYIYTMTIGEERTSRNVSNLGTRNTLTLLAVDPEKMLVRTLRKSKAAEPRWASLRSYVAEYADRVAKAKESKASKLVKTPKLPWVEVLIESIDTLEKALNNHTSHIDDISKRIAALEVLFDKVTAPSLKSLPSNFSINFSISQVKPISTEKRDMIIYCPNRPTIGAIVLVDGREMQVTHHTHNPNNPGMMVKHIKTGISSYDEFMRKYYATTIHVGPNGSNGNV